MKKPGHDPVEHAIQSLQVLLECLRDGHSFVQKNNQLVDLFLEDVKILFREYSTDNPENKWDGFSFERMEVMRCVQRNQDIVFSKDNKKDIFLIVENTVTLIINSTQGQELSERESLTQFISFVTEDLKRFQRVRETQQRMA